MTSRPFLLCLFLKAYYIYKVYSRREILASGWSRPKAVEAKGYPPAPKAAEKNAPAPKAAEKNGSPAPLPANRDAGVRWKGEIECRKQHVLLE